MPELDRFGKDDVSEGKMYAVLAYVSILCIIPLILKKKNPFVLFHGKQGLVLFIAEAATVILSILVPWAYTPLMFVLSALSFWGMIGSLQGAAVQLPLVSDIARKIDL